MRPCWIVAAVLATALLFLAAGLLSSAEPPKPAFSVAGLAVEGDLLVVRFKATYPPGMSGSWDPEAVKQNVARLVTVLDGKWTWAIYRPTLMGDGPIPPPPPPDLLIQAFTVTPDTIKRGESARFVWSCPKAKTVTFNGAPVVVTGNQTLSPSVTTTYTIVATDGPRTETAQRILTVTDTPPPPPPPDTKWQVMIVTETDQLDDLPKGQQVLISGLVFRKALLAKGHAWLPSSDQEALEKAPDRWKPWLEAAKDKPRPTLLLAPLAGGDIKGYALPADEAAFWQFLEKGVK